MQLTNHVGFLHSPELLAPASASLSWVSLNTWVSLGFSLGSGLSSLPCTQCCSQIQTLDGTLVQDQLAARLLCISFCLWWETLGKECPHSWEVFSFLKLITMPQSLSRGVFHFLTCSSIWDIDTAPGFLLSFTILIYLSLSPPQTPLL